MEKSNSYGVTVWVLILLEPDWHAGGANALADITYLQIYLYVQWPINGKK